ncbi:N-carbamoyl-L-amino-acid hydrolase [Pleomorphomonas sp. T1.2MG-36]|uniref:hydantoinase/carbamoylase family amidase n=1 Tax=Pleomorphomonas sp. T1.2MG-36 TaxID=3041167 RepID=UPI002477AA28|nr:hydantoinase/carbamoylase family amidase [Pleomorphomonas sp. T1.2MG-36]CAI9410617.1 N-carbamoyl-L-amino-acid hydrolase [Pleomorphomonas sp. T1.2MG-36]
MTLGPTIDGGRLLARLDAFAAIGGTPAGGVNRPALSVEDRAARALLARLGAARGFSVFQDAAANLFLRRSGADNDRPPFMIGSHLDSQPTGGRYDGALGTLAALEVLETLEDNGIVTASAVELVAWTNEEGSRFSPGAFGSQVHATGVFPDGWQDTVDGNGIRLADELAATLAALPEAIERPLGLPAAGYIELHIEQGPLLERQGALIGVVEGIQGTRWLEVVIEGQVAHAGTTPLADRRDAMAVAAAIIARLQATVMPSDSDARLTVGRLTLVPGAVNVIPGEVTFSIDLRHPNGGEIDRLEAEIGALAAETAASGGCRVSLRRSMDVAPAHFDDRLTGIIQSVAEKRGFPTRRMFSGAFHDALFMARLGPAAMIFVPCRNGLSHNEAEYVEPHQAIAGTQVLCDATLEAMQLGKHR